MEVQEVQDKLNQVIIILEELIKEFESGTTLGVLTQQVHAELVGSRRTVGVVLDNVKEAQEVDPNPEPPPINETDPPPEEGESRKTRDDLPKRAPSPASKADKSRD